MLQIPNDYIVKGSSFRLNAWQRVLPLPIKFNKMKGDEKIVDWICYHPTMNWKPPNAPAPTGDIQGTDGIVLYHIHQCYVPKVPKKVKNFFEREMNKWKQGPGFILGFDPAFATKAFQESRYDWSPEARQLFAYLGIGALVIMGVAVAWEIGLVAGIAAIAEGGLSTLMASPLYFEALGQSSMIAKHLWSAGTGVASLLPIMQPL